MKNAILVKLLALLILFLSVPLIFATDRQAMQAENQKVFSAVDQLPDGINREYQKLKEAYPHQVRERFVRLRFNAIKKAMKDGQQATTMRLNLFADVNIPINTQHLKRENDNYVSWLAPLDAVFFGKAILTLSRNWSMGLIHVDDKVFELIALGDGYIWLIEIFGPSLADTPCGTSTVVTTGGHPLPPPSPAGTTIQLLVLFGSDGIAYVTPRMTMLEIAYRNLLNETFNTFKSSEIFFNVVIDIAPFITPVGGRFVKDLNNLKTNPMVDALRTQRQADLVSLIVVNVPSNVGGLGVTPSIPNDKAAFSVVDLASLYAGYALPHEIGHNFSMNHDRIEKNGGLLTDCDYGYINCWPNDNIAVYYHTIMAYPDNCNASDTYPLGGFSTPMDNSQPNTTMIYGVDCSVQITGKNGSANNCQNIKNYALTISQFR